MRFTHARKNVPGKIQRDEVADPDTTELLLPVKISCVPPWSGLARWMDSELEIQADGPAGW